MLSRARRGACEIVAGAALWRCRCEIVAGAALWRLRCRCASGCVFVWQGRIRQLSRGTGCCRARGGGRAKSGQAQHFGDAVAKSWQAQHFGDAVAEVVAGAAFCASGCVFVWQGSHSAALEGQDVVARAAGGVRNRGRRSTLAMPLRNRGRRSTLAMPLPKSWQAQHSVHLGVCLCGRGRIRQLSRGTGCCRARGGGRAKLCRRSTLAMPLRNRGRRSTLAMPLPKSWQAQHSVHLGVCLCGRGRIRQLSRGTGCCRARGGGRAKSWQAQHFSDAVAEVVAGAAFCASGCVFVWQGSHSAAV